MITTTILIIIIINITIMIMVIAADLKDWLLSCYKLQTTSHASVLSRLLRIVLMVIVLLLVIVVIRCYPPAENCKHPGPEPCTGEAQPSVTEEAQI